MFLFGGAAVHWCLPLRLRTGWLALVSAGFLFTVDPMCAGLLAAWTILFFHVAPLGATAQTKGPRVTSTLVVVAIAALIVFKYVKPIAAALVPGSIAASIVRRRDAGPAVAAAPPPRLWLRR